MASMAKVLERYDAMKTAAKRARDNNKDKIERATSAVATIAGGALGGYLEAEHSDKNVFGLDLGIAVGGAATAAGLLDLAGKQSRVLEAVGTGLLAWEAGKMVVEHQANQGGESSGVGALGAPSMGQLNDTFQRLRNRRAA